MSHQELFSDLINGSRLRCPAFQHWHHQCQFRCFPHADYLKIFDKQTLLLPVGWHICLSITGLCLSKGWDRRQNRRFLQFFTAKKGEVQWIVRVRSCGTLAGHKQRSKLRPLLRGFSMQTQGLIQDMTLRYSAMEYSGQIATIGWLPRTMFELSFAFCYPSVSLILPHLIFYS